MNEARNTSADPTIDQADFPVSPRVRAIANGVIMSLAVTAMAVDIAGDTPASCAAPSQTAIEEVTTTLDTARKLPDPYVPAGIPNLGQYGRIRLTDELNAREKQLGISFAAPDPKALQAMESPRPTEPLPFSIYMTAARSVLDQYGIKLRLSPNMDGQTSAATPTPKQLQTATAINEVTGIMQFFSSMPAQLIHAVPNLKEIDLTAKGTERGFGKFGGEALLDSGTMLVDVVNNPDTDYLTTPHEFFHFLDVAMCGSVKLIDRDPGYSSLNRHASYAGKWPLPKNFLLSEPPTFDMRSQHFYELLGKIADAQALGYTAMAKKLRGEAVANLKNVEMQSNYSYYNILEDKAELGEQTLMPFDYFTVLDGSDNVRRQKFFFLLGRLQTFAPKVFEDFVLRYRYTLSPYSGK